MKSPRAGFAYCLVQQSIELLLTFTHTQQWQWIREAARLFHQSAGAGAEGLTEPPLSLTKDVQLAFLFFFFPNDWQWHHLLFICLCQQSYRSGCGLSYRLQRKRGVAKILNSSDTQDTICRGAGVYECSCDIMGFVFWEAVYVCVWVCVTPGWACYLL